jgi:hypothetical protein
MSNHEAEFDRKIEAEEEDLHRYNRAARRRNMIMAIVAFIAVIFGLLAGWLALENDRLATANAQYGQAQAEEKQVIAKEAQKALCGTKDSEIYDKAICEKLADAAQEPPPPEAPTAVGPSQEELVKAFREYCAEGNCQGRDGTSPTADDIATAFVRFCSDGRCTGPAGKDGEPAEPGAAGADGKDGKNGVDGQALPPSGEMVLAAVTTYCSTSGACVGPAGAVGPPPTAEAVLAAVKQVCANNACQGPMGPAGADSTVPGPTGPPGPAGANGADGRGIQSAFCGDDARWVITYTDGTTSDGGACRTTFIPGANP